MNQAEQQLSEVRSGRALRCWAARLARLALVAVSAWLGRTAAAPAGEQRPAAPRQDVLVAVGAPGTPEYGEQFRRWADRWRQAAEAARAGWRLVGGGPADADNPDDRRALRMALQQLAAASSPEPLWIVLIGHGTFDGRTAKFNLRGPDVSAAELAEWLANARRPLVLINCASASGPFINRLSAPNRVIITATKSGYEYNFARFGDYFSAAIADPAADLDKDGQTSALEALVAAAARVREFYQQEGRLATEHALIDDNGDGLGTPAEWFRGVRAVRAPEGGAETDGLAASQQCLVRSPEQQRWTPEARARRNELERAIEALRRRKADMETDAYYAELEPLLLELARLYYPRP